MAQKLQQRVSSVESLFWGSGRAENLFRSGSRDSLVRSTSRESLTPLAENEAPGAPAFDPPSDIESEAEDAPGNAEALSKEQLLYRLHRVEKSLGNYRGKYSEVVAIDRNTDRNKGHCKDYFFLFSFFAKQKCCIACPGCCRLAGLYQRVLMFYSFIG